jgi:hypothetical protein
MTASETIKKTMNSLSQLKTNLYEPLLISIITFIFVIIMLLIIFSYIRLRGRNCNVMDSIYGSLNGKIRSIDNNEKFNYTFKDYYIKSAYNCCSGGNYKNDFVDLCIMKDLLKQGVRCLDFEIFSIDDQPVIATSTSDSFYIKETFNYIDFVNAMNVIRDYAFSTSTAPNSADPIIIHLRIKSTNQTMYQNFALLLENYNSILLGKEYDSEYQGQNFGDVELRNLMGKVVIIVEKNNSAVLECPEFYKFINMTSKSVFMRLYHYYEIRYPPSTEEMVNYNKQNMTIGIPDKGSDPENPSAIVMRELGCQLLAMRYSELDVNIEENNMFFDNNGYAFVLKPIHLRYIPETIPLPPPQNPELAFAERTVQSDFYKFNI